MESTHQPDTWARLADSWVAAATEVADLIGREPFTDHCRDAGTRVIKVWTKFNDDVCQALAQGRLDHLRVLIPGDTEGWLILRFWAEKHGADDRLLTICDAIADRIDFFYKDSLYNLYGPYVPPVADSVSGHA